MYGVYQLWCTHVTKDIIISFTKFVWTDIFTQTQTSVAVTSKTDGQTWRLYLILNKIYLPMCLKSHFRKYDCLDVCLFKFDGLLWNMTWKSSILWNRASGTFYRPTKWTGINSWLYINYLHKLIVNKFVTVKCNKNIIVYLWTYLNSFHGLVHWIMQLFYVENAGKTVGIRN